MEIDFWGLHSRSGAGGITQAAPRMRLAYLELHPGEGVRLTAGQQSSAFAPLTPATMSHVSIVMNSGAGNLWARLPQLRVDVTEPNFDVAVALTRPHGADVSMPPPAQSDLVGAGELSRLPFVQARVAVKSGKQIVGLSGHYGTLDFRVSDEDKVTSVAGALDFKVAVDRISLMGQAFYAENVGTLFSGIAASVPDGVVTERKGVGGWGQVSVKATDSLTVSAGGGVEIREVKDMEGDIVNVQAFASVVCAHLSPVTLGLQAVLSKTDTDASDKDAFEENVALSLNAQYKF